MRKAEKLDLDVVMQKLKAMLDYSPAPQMRYADYHVAMASVVRAMREGRAYICNGYFIMVDVGSDWYTDRRYLIEQIILKVYDAPHTVASAIAGLEEIAKEHGCHAIAVGDTQVGYMTPLYQAAGFTTIGTQLIKESTWVSSER